ncbi:MAG TPA: phosphatase PAP2 family protein [Puia sp.]|nr:phosphatase PAP2 family protein [Puia sp.]
MMRFIGQYFWAGLVYTLAITGTARAQSSLQRLDENILADLETTRTPAETRIALIMAKANNYVNAGVPAGLLIAGLIRNDADMKKNALYTLSSTALSYLLDYTLKQLVKRPRPFLTDGKLNPIYRPREYSFPSGHTSSVFGLATSLSRAYPKWYVIAPSYLWAAGMGYSRMYLGVHYPSDVGAGALLGVGSAFSLGFLRR